jgi:hypothetical protein
MVDEAAERKGDGQTKEVAKAILLERKADEGDRKLQGGEGTYGWCTRRSGSDKMVEKRSSAGNVMIITARESSVSRAAVVAMGGENQTSIAKIHTCRTSDHDMIPNRANISVSVLNAMGLTRLASDQ